MILFLLKGKALILGTWRNAHDQYTNPLSRPLTALQLVRTSFGFHLRECIESSFPFPPPLCIESFALGFLFEYSRCKRKPWTRNNWISVRIEKKNDLVKFRDQNNKVLKQLRRRRQRERQKSMVYISKTTTLHLHDAFCMKLPNFTRPLHGVGEHSTKTFFFFF